MKRTPWKRKPPSEQKPMKRSPMKRSTKPMNRVGTQGRKNAKADRVSKKELERRGIDYCQLCGNNTGLSRSHSHKRRHESDLTKIALLCIFPCHNFIELELNPEKRAEVNNFLIETNLEGEAKFEAVIQLIPEEKREKFVKAILNQ